MSPSTQTELSNLNTMALASTASQFHSFTSDAQIVSFLKQRQQQKQQGAASALPLLVLSGGSNVLLPPKLDACVVHPNLKGVSKIKENETYVWVEAKAGEVWHEFVMRCVNSGWYGLENLALIPGLVGAAPVQNIGAYGVEVTDFFEELTCINLVSGEPCTFNKQACQFAYRDSFFKQHPNQWLITSVTFRLLKTPHLKLNYGDIAKFAGDNPTPKSVADAVISIRQSKLPDPANTPNCGSFFKNPIVAGALAERLLKAHPQMPHYPQGQKADRVKLAGGWLIDQAGLKGFSQGHIGTHKDQALVVVNHAKGVATQADIAKFAKLIQEKVFDKFGVTLEREPVWVNADGSLT